MNHVVPEGWAQTGKTLTKTIVCNDFLESLAFVLEIGREAEAADHHPDIDIRYNKVLLSLCTHSAGHRLTEKDFALAEKINGLDPVSVRLSKDQLNQRYHP